jgi:hypothetical protein
MSDYEIENTFDIFNDDEELDDSWLNEIENEDKLYTSFYTEENEIVKLVYIYINRDNKIYYIKKDDIILDNKLIDKTKLIFLLKKNKIYNSKDHKLISILQYNIDLEPEDLSSYLKNSEKYNFLSVKSTLSEIKWDDSIHFFKNLNSLHIIFYENVVKENKTNTKKIYIRESKKRRKSRKKLT